MDLPVELQDMFSLLLGKTTISSWNIFKNNGLTTLNIRFNDYGQNEVQDCKYRRVSEKQQQRNAMRSKQYKAKTTNNDIGVQTRSMSQKDISLHNIAEDKECTRSGSVSSNNCSHIDTHGHMPLTPIKTMHDPQNNIDLNVSVSSSHSIVEEAPEWPESEHQSFTEVPQAPIDPIPLSEMESDSDSSEVSQASEATQKEMNCNERAVNLFPEANGNGTCIYADSKPKRRHYRSHYNQKVCRYCHKSKVHLVCYSCTKTHDKQRKYPFLCQLSQVPHNFKQEQ